MKTILCYGDSLTWGWDPEGGARFPFPERWPGILQARLGDRVRVVEEALPGRTTASDSPWLADRNGRTTLPFLLESHAPIDLVVLLLGGNDVAPVLNLSAESIAGGTASLVWIVQKSLAGPGGAAPKVLLVSPPSIGTLSPLMAIFQGGGEGKCAALARANEVVAKGYGCLFLDAAKVVQPSRADGLHLDRAAQRVLGERIAEVVGKAIG
jgi:lysophospholipase L1-like esterase